MNLFTHSHVVVIPWPSHTCRVYDHNFTEWAQRCIYPFTWTNKSRCWSILSPTPSGYPRYTFIVAHLRCGGWCSQSTHQKIVNRKRSHGPKDNTTTFHNYYNIVMWVDRIIIIVWRMFIMSLSNDMTLLSTDTPIAWLGNLSHLLTNNLVHRVY